MEKVLLPPRTEINNEWVRRGEEKNKSKMKSKMSKKKSKSKMRMSRRMRGGREQTQVRGMKVKKTYLIMEIEYEDCHDDRKGHHHHNTCKVRS